MNCSKCGTQNPKGIQFCFKCGFPLKNIPVVELKRVSPPYAGFWIRLVAYLIDSVIVGCGLGIIFGLMYLIFTIFGPSGTKLTISHLQAVSKWSDIIYFIFSILSIVLPWLYFSLLESSSRRATLGKRVYRIVVTDLNGSRISFARASGRYWGKIVSGLTLCIG